MVFTGSLMYLMFNFKLSNPRALARVFHTYVAQIVTNCHPVSNTSHNTLCPVKLYELKIKTQFLKRTWEIS